VSRVPGEWGNCPAGKCRGHLTLSESWAAAVQTAAHRGIGSADFTPESMNIKVSEVHLKASLSWRSAL